MGSTLSNRRFTDLVITVGSNPKIEFRVHKLIMCTHSSYFSRLFTDDSSFKESNESRVCLPDEDPDIFERLVIYLYGHWATNDTIVEAAKLYKMADYFGCPDLKGAAMDDIVTKIKNGPSGFSKYERCQPPRQVEPIPFHRRGPQLSDSIDRETIAAARPWIRNSEGIKPYDRRQWCRRPEMSLTQRRSLDLFGIHTANINTLKSGHPNLIEDPGATHGDKNAEDGLYLVDLMKFSGNDSDHGNIEPTIIRSDWVGEVAEVFCILATLYQTSDGHLYRQMIEAIRSMGHSKDFFGSKEVRKALDENSALAMETIDCFAGI